MKKVIAIILSIIMTLSVFAVPVSAQEVTTQSQSTQSQSNVDEAFETVDNVLTNVQLILEMVVDIIKAVHELVGTILSMAGEVCPMCGEMHDLSLDLEAPEEPEDPAEPEAPTDPDVVDADKDGISDEDEAIYGTDINKADTDDDGYTDFEELFLMGTDPLKTDEKDVDTDGDGLTDYDEVKKYGTDINSEDTDSDGLTDYDEVNRYNTDPTKKDTDGDGLSDVFEIENGLDPLKVSTDGKTNDGDVKIEQTTSEESVSDALLDEENVAKPSLEGEVAGVLSEKVFITTSPDRSLDDNRAVIGEPIVVDGEEDYVDDLKLMFDLSGYEGALENLSICKLDEDGNIVPVESEIEGSSISCGAEANATYFVMDIDAFLKALGVDLDAYKAMTFSLRGRSAEVAGDKISGQADIVFVIDTTGSMSDEIHNVIYNVTDFTERLATEYNVKVNYALIDYRDLEEDGPGTTKVIKNGSSNWFSDVSTYITALNKLRADGGGDTPECAIDALETARLLDFRKSASKFVILITDADYKVLNDYGVKSMSEEAERLAADGINTSVVTSSSYASDYTVLHETTGGVYANIYGNFSAELLKLADLIGEETSDGEWVILKHGYRYVKLPAIPTVDSTEDTDGDGISDYKELGKKVTIDLTTFIKAQLANNGVPFEVYTGKTSVDVFDSIADPTLYDTDGDGYEDDEDPTPWSIGLKNGEVGTLTIVSNYQNEYGEEGLLKGHSFLVYKSKVYSTLDFSNFLEGYETSTGDWNDVKAVTASSSYKTTPGSYLSIGAFQSELACSESSSGAGNGVYYNLECYKVIKTIITYKDNAYLTKTVTHSQIEKLLKYCSRDDVNYWTLFHNCSSVASSAWNYVFDDNLSAKSLSSGLHIVDNPTALKNNILKRDGGKVNYDLADELTRSGGGSR